MPILERQGSHAEGEATGQQQQGLDKRGAKVVEVAWPGPTGGRVDRSHLSGDYHPVEDGVAHQEDPEDQ